MQGGGPTRIVRDDTAATRGQHPVVLITLDDLRRFAVTNSLFPPTTLKRVFIDWGLCKLTLSVRRREPRT